MAQDVWGGRHLTGQALSRHQHRRTQHADDVSMAQVVHDGSFAEELGLELSRRAALGLQLLDGHFLRIERTPVNLGWRWKVNAVEFR